MYCRRHGRLYLFDYPFVIPSFAEYQHTFDNGHELSDRQGLFRSVFPANDHIRLLFAAAAAFSGLDVTVSGIDAPYHPA